LVESALRENVQSDSGFVSKVSANFLIVFAKNPQSFDNYS